MKKKQRSITSHIRRMVVLDIILLIVIMEICSFVSIQKALLADTYNEISAKTESGVEFIESWLKKKVSQTETIAKAFKTMENISDDEAEKFLIDCAGGDSDVMNYYLCRSGFQYVVYNNGIFEMDPTKRSWWVDCWAENKTIITDAYIDANSGGIVVSVATPFYMGDRQAVILADITIDTLIKNLSILSNDYMNVFVTASDGTFIVHDDKALCMQTDGSSTNVSEVYSLNLESRKIQIVNTKADGSNFIGLGNVESTGWKLGAYMSRSYLSGRIAKSVVFVVGTALIVGGICIVYLALILKRQLSPMNGMKNFIRETVVGEENIPYYKHEEDEISFLIEELKEKFVATIRKTLTEMQGVDENIREAKLSVNGIVDAVSNISAVIEETATAMDTQTDNINHITDDCDVISNASQTVANQAQQMASKSTEIVGEINELCQRCSH